MTGTAINDTKSSVVKNSTGILMFSKDMTWDYTDYSECVRCGKCVEYCPVHLYPNKLGIYAEHKQYSKSRRMGYYGLRRMWYLCIFFAQLIGLY